MASLARFRRVLDESIQRRLLFEYMGGLDPRATGATVARADAATCATYVDATRVVRTVAAHVPRYQHFIGGVGPYLLVEGSRANVCLYSETFGTGWTAANTPTRVAAAHTASGISLDLIGDDDAGSIKGYYQDPTFTGDGVKAFSICVKEGSSASSVLWLRDISGATFDRCRFVLTWSGGLPVLTAGGAGTYLGYEPLADGVYRLFFLSSAITAANNHRLYCYPATDNLFAVANIGTLYAGGVHLENGPFPASYIKTVASVVTRAADDCWWPISPIPRVLTIYGAFVDGVANASGLSNTPIFIGDAAAAAPICGFAPSLGKYRMIHQTSGGLVASQAADTVAWRNAVELRGVLNLDGSVMLGQTINGAAEVVAAVSGARPLAAAWSGAAIRLSGYDAASAPFMALRSLKVADRVRTMWQLGAR